MSVETPILAAKSAYNTNDILVALAYAKTDKAALAQLRDMAPSRSVLRSVYSTLVKLGKPTTLVEQYCQEQGFRPAGRNPSKKRPREGDVRVYSAQQVDGSCFIRLPLDHLAIPKRGRVSAFFERGRIVVQPSA